ncbi:hypothetical protein [Rhodothermus profundi]|uniref:Phosphate-selective porin O and P n=1 Tax=Rhodothermus profundi TaxID=633813 RepID=A0A1M6WNR6_9BACT|nr:hypothetical protein [Rhodothermus profundi]SHK95239.1 hypothetical protein SAMN04488087_2368 [Rhodothermus profundi]
MMRRYTGWLLLMAVLALPARAQEAEERARLGGYGAIRFEATNLERQYNTFTFRRFVLTTDVAITSNLRFISELELERFRKLELEKAVEGEGGVTVEQAVEGTDQSEIAIEQAWLEWAIDPAFRLRAGGLLVPVGRFNIHHDDNQWMFPRRSLVDRGAPVLPSKSAWNELGLGIAGDVPLGLQGLLSYEFYVVNGVQLDVEVEQKTISRPEGGSNHVDQELELKFEPFTGTFGNDTKQAKTVTGRVALSPSLGVELALSGYYGRYTPQYLPAAYVGSVGIDFLLSRGALALEGEYVYTSMGDVETVARGFAQRVYNQEGVSNGLAAAGVPLESEVKVELVGLSRVRQGYWIEMRYAFFPEFLRATFFGQGTQPLWYAGVRWEQVWFRDLLKEAAFEAGLLEAFETSDRWVNRLTFGLTYRPTPLVGFQLAYELTWTNKGRSLGDVTNYLIADGNEDVAQAFIFGVVFGF